MGLKLAIGLRMDALAPVAPGWILPGASLDLDFTNGRYYAEGGGALSSLLSCNRAGSGLAQNADGSWTSFGSNVPRITDRGLLVEEARTNSIKNNSMSGASIGSSPPLNWGTNVNDGLSTSFTSFGTEFGLPYIDWRVSGTTNGTGTFAQLRFTSTNEISAAQNQIWSNSFFARIVGGSLANISTCSVIINEHDSGMGFLTGGSVNFTPTSSIQRFSHARVLINASAAFAVPFIGIGHSASVLSIDITIRIYAPQMEQGAFPTSPILTASAAITRSADLVTLSGSAATAALAARAAQFETNALNRSSYCALLSFTGGSICAFTTDTEFTTNPTGGSQAQAAFGSGNIGGAVKAAAGMDATGVTARANNGSPVSAASGWLFNTGTVYVCNISAGSRATNGPVRRITLGPTKDAFDDLTA